MNEIQKAELMVAALDQDGDFRVVPIEWTLEKSDKSEAVALAVRFAVMKRFYPGQGWSEQWGKGYFVDARFWIVSKDGNLAEKIIQTLSRAGLWSGDFEAFEQAPPKKLFILTVSGEEYQGKMRYRGEWLNANADEPPARGGFAPANPALLSNLRSRFQSKARAVAGGTGAVAAPIPAKRPQAAQVESGSSPALGEAYEVENDVQAERPAKAGGPLEVDDEEIPF